jgi:3-oxoacyl-[acyl-carrier protein] reductase
MTDGVVVTGAARGIGAAIAARFAGDGARVVGIDLDGGGLARTMEKLPDAHAVIGDVRDEAVLEKACVLAADAGRVRAFVTNAGITAPGDSLDYPVEDWDRLMGVHATAAFLGARTAARHLTAWASASGRRTAPPRPRSRASCAPSPSSGARAAFGSTASRPARSPPSCSGG